MRSINKHIFTYLGCSAFLLLALLWFNHYSSSRVYVVYLDHSELGVVSDASEIESFVDDLVLRCGDLYGMDLHLEEKITFSEEFRAGVDPNPLAVRDLIRRKISFLTEAYLIKVDGEPLVPVASKSALEEVVKTLYTTYCNDKSAVSGKLVEVTLLQDITFEECTVSPDTLYTSEELMTLLTDQDDPELPADDNLLATAHVQRGFTTSSQLAGIEALLELGNLANFAVENSVNQPAENAIKLQVKTVEEVSVIEKIPFPVEKIEDQTLFVNQTEIEIPGLDGDQEVVYHIVRVNGVEFERIVIEETPLTEPVTQVERVGVKALPASPAGGGGGSGSFVWPVQGEGIIYNGFRSGHAAIDIHIASGTSVLAADSGTVWFTGWGSTQGNYIIIHHSAYWTLYLHNSVNLVNKGDRVSRGQVIGKVGATGRAKGAHLHFEVRVDDGTREWHSYYQHKAINPLQFFNR